LSYKPRTLFRLIEDINQSLFLPHIQRPFVWELDQMRRLFDSLMRNYPIQTLLFWRTTDAIKARRFMPVVQWDPELSAYYEPLKSVAGPEKVFVLDGQQRLQTLYALFAGGVEDDGGGSRESFFDVTSGLEIDVDGLLFRLAFAKQSPGAGWYRLRDLREHDHQRNAEEIAERLNDVLDAQPGESVEERKAREKRVRKNLSQLVGLLREERHFWVEELDGVANAYPYKAILDIFVRVNSGGTKLDAADLMFAAMKQEWSEVEEKVEDVVGILNDQRLSFDKTFVLKCLVVSQGKGAELTPEKFTSESGADLLKLIEEEWERAEAAFLQLRDFIRNDLHLVSDKLIRSYGSFVPIFDFLVHNPKPDETNRQLLRAYYYKSQLFNWYRARTDSILNVMHGVLGKELSGKFPMAAVKDYFAGLGNDVLLADQHLLETRLRFILLNLVYAEQFGTSPFDVLFKGNEPHVDHIYPKSGLRNGFGLSAAEVNHLGNYRFVGATDNVRKRAEKPDSYFSRLKVAKVAIEKHLLLPEFAKDPALMKWDVEVYRAFRDSRLARIGEIAKAVVNAEVKVGA
jgi:Protein of unknown function DUF262